MQSPPMDTTELRQRVRAGWQPRYVLFLTPEPSRVGLLGSECLSQWYPAPMEVDGVRFATAEHYMMWCKAQLFGDVDVAQRVLATESPGVAKQLGREVRGFDGEIWARHRFDVVVRGTLAKFRQHPALRAYLLDTGGQVLAEASPVDYIWGIGFEDLDEQAKNPFAWKGLNLLGFALMQGRAQLAADVPNAR
jgi:ribA/ribD-fused uncharacterized protein